MKFPGPNRSASGAERDASSGHLNDDSSELYRDLTDFTETKRKIEELIRFKQSLIDQEHSDFTAKALEFAQYKLRAMDAINQHFDSLRPDGA